MNSSNSMENAVKSSSLTDKGEGKEQSNQTSSKKRKNGEQQSTSIAQNKKAKSNHTNHKSSSTFTPSSSSSKQKGSFNYNPQKTNSSQPKSAETNNNRNLPVYDFEQQILQSVRDHQVTIIVGETGSGKSTQIPQILLNHGVNRRQVNGETKEGAIVCTQPRRVAAVTIAQKVAEERSSVLGEEVGYSIRFEDRSSASTKIKYVTDGVLLRECMSDPLLSKYSVIILDEAHERSLQTDILMGLIRRMQDGDLRDIRIIVMSATLQIELFSSFFTNTNVVIVPGRQFPVTTIYSPEPEPEYVDAALSTCLKIHENEEPGGVLVFLPGQEDIESLTQLLQEKLPTVRSYFAKNGISPSPNDAVSDVKPSVIEEADGSKTIGIENLYDFVIRPLYASMPPEDQLKVFDPIAPTMRKFILATNIAETSVTISGVKYVVDTGFVKTRFINEHTGIEMLKTMPVAKSQANQRTGRAGRECPGKCFRLYPRDIFEQLPDATVPEIQRMNIAQVFLQLKALNIESFHSFPFLSPPTPAVVRQALETLLHLGALDREQNLTEIGTKLAMLPLHPSFAYFLIKSEDFQCVQEALIAVSLLSVDNVFLQPFKDEDKQKAYHAHRVFASKDGDVITLVNIYNQWIKAKKDKKWTSRNYLSYRGLTVAENIKQQLTTLLKSKLKMDTSVSCYPERKDQLLRCLCLSFCNNIAQSIQSMDMRDHQKVDREELKKDKSVVRNSNKNTSYRAPSALVQDIQSKNTSNAPYRTLRGQQFVHIHPSSVLFSMIKNKKLPAFVIYADLLITNKQYMKYISVIEANWLTELFPEKFKSLT